MVTPELISFIRAEREKGRTKEDIQALLIKHGGWTEVDIEEVFERLEPPQAIAEVSIPAKPEFSADINAAPTVPESVSLEKEHTKSFALVTATKVKKTDSHEKYFWFGVVIFLGCIVLALGRIGYLPTTLALSSYVFSAAVFTSFFMVTAGTYTLNHLTKRFDAQALSRRRSFFIMTVQLLFGVLITVLYLSAIFSAVYTLLLASALIICTVGLIAKVHMVPTKEAIRIWILTMLICISVGVVTSVAFSFIWVVLHRTTSSSTLVPQQEIR